MNKLEERHKQAIISGGFSSAHPHMNAINCAAITKEVAIGFLNWFYNLRPESKQHDDDELFEMYLNTLK